MALLVLGGCGRLGYDSGSPLTAGAGILDAAHGRVGLSACPAAFGDCNGDAADGCESSLSSPYNCGQCGNACFVAHTLMACVAGRCEAHGCEAHFGDCDGEPRNGCETNLRLLTSCGGCGLRCELPQANETCARGWCELASCAAGYGDCDNVTENGCETALDSLLHCGACGNSCALPHASTFCSAGTCSFGGCDSGFDDCDGDQGNGCETALNTLAHCGACDQPCDLDNASEACESGSCQISSCHPGFGDCDAVLSNGCETPLNTLANCGACGQRCELPGADTSCSLGSCQLVNCDPGLADCDADQNNGCEVSLDDPQHCGGCGLACDDGDPCTTDSCAGGACGYSDSGQCSCPGSCSGGNCGTCAPACSCDQSCSGNCSSLCSAGTTCRLVVSSSNRSMQICKVAASCELRCNNSNNCRQRCEDGSSCELTCSNADCVQDCQGEAQCLSRCGNADCQLGCPAGATSCGGGVQACNRPCP